MLSLSRSPQLQRIQIIMKKYTSKDRRAWMRHYFKSGQNISATCREFGITRVTFYKWRDRYDPERPSSPLREHSRRPHTTRTPSWNHIDLLIVAELSMDNPTFGAERLSRLVAERGWKEMSRATVGRLLAKIRERCPTSKQKDGRHNAGMHQLERDIRNAHEQLGA